MTEAALDTADIMLTRAQAALAEVQATATSPKTSPAPSPPSTPTKRRRHRHTSSKDFVAIRIDQIYFVLKAIEKNTRPPPPSLGSRYRNGMGVVAVCCAMLLSLTMLYMLYVGYYPPASIFAPASGGGAHIFFLDRLHDLAEVIARLRDGTIFGAMTDMFVAAFKASVSKEIGVGPVVAPNGFAPYLPPGAAGGN